jgi:hypothetical protein
MRIIGPNFRVVLRLRDGVVAEAARPVSYMKGWRVERVLALAARWGCEQCRGGASATCAVMPAASSSNSRRCAEAELLECISAPPADSLLIA